MITKKRQNSRFFVNFVEKTLIPIKSNSPYAKRPEGSRKSGLDFAQTFGTVRNIKV